MSVRPSEWRNELLSSKDMLEFTCIFKTLHNGANIGLSFIPPTRNLFFLFITESYYIKASPGFPIPCIPLGDFSSSTEYD